MAIAGHERSRSGVAVLAIATLLAWGGCSVEKNYKVLSFFFDGVPEPASVQRQAAAEREGGSRVIPKTVVSWHTAYVERRCSACHGDKTSFGFTTSGFADLDGHACGKCHPDATAAPFPHGPVAAFQCTACHEPHEAGYPHLLIAASPQLCLRCHGNEFGDEPPESVHGDLARDCLLCHLAHGGDNGSFLRPRETWAEGP